MLSIKRVVLLGLLLNIPCAFSQDKPQFKVEERETWSGQVQYCETHVINFEERKLDCMVNGRGAIVNSGDQMIIAHPGRCLGLSSARCQFFAGYR